MKKSFSTFFLTLALVLMSVVGANAQTRRVLINQDFGTGGDSYDADLQALQDLGWSETGYVAGSYTWYTYTWGVRSGAGVTGSCAYFYAYYSYVSEDMMVSPQCSLSLDKKTILSFTYKNGPSGGGDMDVYVLSSSNAILDTLRSHLSAGPNWTTYDIVIPDQFKGQTVKIGFKGRSASSSSMYYYIDDVKLADAPECQPITDLSLNSISTTGCNLTWSFKGADYGDEPVRCNIVVKDVLNDSVVLRDTTGDGTHSYSKYDYTLSSLQPNTTYRVAVGNDCSNNNIFVYDSAFIEFTTLKAPQNLPYVQNFDTLVDLPDGSYRSPEDDNRVGLNSTSTYCYGQSGKSLKLVSTSTDLAMFIMPGLNTPANNVEISFQIRCSSKTVFQVGFVADPYDPNTFQPLYTDSTKGNASWREITFQTNDKPYTLNPSMFAIMIPKGISATAYIDNIDIHSIPSCVRPENITVSNVQATTADVSWTAATASNYVIRLQKLAGDSAWLTFNPTQSPYTLTGLDPQTKYGNLTIQAICAGADSSRVKSYGETFTTQCAVADSPIFKETFESLAANKVPDCWSMDWLNKSSSSATTPFSRVTSSDYGAQVKNGSQSMKLVDQSSGAVSYLSTKAIPIDQANKYMLSVWVYRGSYSTAKTKEGIQFWITDAPGDTTNNGTKLGYVHREYTLSPAVTSEGWYLYEYLIPVQGPAKYVTVVGISEYGAATFFDDLEVKVAPTCNKVTDIALGTPSTSSIDMTWSAGASETAWIVKYTVKQGTDTIKADSVVVNNTPSLTIDQLPSSSTLSLKASITSFCGVGDLAETVNFSSSFNTLCDKVTTFPYTQDVEGVTTPNLPACWSSQLLVQAGSTSYPQPFQTSTYSYHSGSKAFQLRDMSVGNISLLTSPQFQIDSAGKYEVSLWVYRASGSKTSEGIGIWAGTGSDSTQRTELGFIHRCMGYSPIESTEGWYKYSYPIPVAGDIYIYIEGVSEYGQATYFDDVTIREIPNCPDLTGAGVAVSNIKANNATLTVTDTTANNSWTYAYGITGTPASACTIVDATTPSVVLTGLNAETEYVVYARRKCAGEDGAWSAAVSFKTTCAAQTIPFVDDFENTATGLLEGCYVINNTSTYYQLAVLSQSSSASGNSVYNNTLTGSKGVVTVYSGGTSPYSTSADLDVLALVHLEAGKNYEVSLYAKMYDDSWGGYPWHLTFEYGESSSSLTTKDSYAVNNATFARFGSFFTVATDGDYYVGFHTSPDGYYHYPYFDDFTIREMACIPPTGTSVLALSSDTVSIHIESNASQWEVAVSSESIDITGTVTGDIYHDTINVPDFTVRGLDVNTEYYYTVRSICSGTPSDWMQPSSFRTACAAFPLPLSESFDVAGSEQCWHPNANISRNTSNRYSGTASLMSKRSPVASPELLFDTVTNYMITGRVKVVGKDSAEMMVALSSDPNNTDSILDLDYIIVPKKDDWFEFTKYFNTYSDVENAKFVILYYADTTIYLDDIYIGKIPTCPKPIDVQISNVGPNSFDIAFTDAAGANQWVVYVNGAPNVINSTSTTISGLTGNTAYTVKLAAICGSSDTSLITDCGSIKTACDVIELPYTESFESVPTSYSQGMLGDICWTDLNAIDYNAYYYGSASYNPTNGSKLLLLSAKNTSPSLYVIMPEFVATNQFRVTYDLKFENSSNSGDIAFGYLNDVADSSSFVNIATHLCTASGSTSWNTYNQDVTNLPANARLAFKYSNVRSTTYAYYAYLDNIKVAEIRSCSDPYTPTVSDIDASSAKVAFTDTCAAHTAWEYVYGLAGFDKSTVTPVSLDTVAFTLTGLNSSTAYDVYVRAVCDVGDYSNWIKATFTTTTLPAQLPYVTDFSDGAMNAAWLISGTGTNTFTFGSDANAVFGSGSSALYVTDGNGYTYNTGSESSSIVARLFQFGASNYSIEFDWKCSGGESGYDYARFFLVSANASSIMPSYSTLPTGAIPLDGGTTRCVVTGDQHVATIIDMTNRPGMYYLVYYWRNDGSYGTANYPLSVGNLSVKEVTCNAITSATQIESLTTVNSVAVKYVNPNQGASVRWAISTSTSLADSIQTGVATSDTIFVSNLSSSSNYTLMIAAECSATDVSMWYSVPVATSCDVVTTFPYVEDFESTTFPPVCWTERTMTAGEDYYGDVIDGHWYRYTTSYSSSYYRGTGGAYLYGDEGASASLATAQIQFDSTREYHLSFAMYRLTYSYYTDAVKVYYGPNPSTTGATLLGTYTAYDPNITTSDLVDIDIDLPASAAGLNYIIFVGEYNYYGYVYIDDIKVDIYPTCRNLAAPTVEGTTAHTATVSEPIGNRTAIQFGVAPFATTTKPDSIFAYFTSTDGTAIITGLDSLTNYLVYARGICNEGDTSAWSTAVKVTTKADDCFKPDRLHVVGNVLDTSVTIAWGGAPSATMYQYIFSNSTTADTATTTATQVTINGLTPQTNCSFMVRSICGTADTTDWSLLSFKTAQSVSAIPFVCDFEDSQVNQLWATGVSGTNAFAIGSATNHGGSNALYISNDDGTSYSYTNSSTSAAFSRVLLNMTAGNYMVSYDYYNKGEGSYDYGRVFLYPAANQFDAVSSMPSPQGGLKVCEGNIQVMTNWATANYVVTVPEDDLYFFQVNWRNDNSGGSNPPLAIDNVTIEPIYCMPLTSLNTITVNSTNAKFEVTRYQLDYPVEYGYSTINSLDSVTNWDTIPGGQLTDTIALSGLAANTTYYFFAREICDSIHTSNPLTTTFMTPNNAQSVPFVCSFEATESTSSVWAFANDGNAFIIGDETSSAGSKALYISDDNTSWHYDIDNESYSYAYVPLAFGPGTYEFSFDWIGYGESTYDYARAALTPASFIPQAGNYPSGLSTTALPKGWLSLDGKQKMNLDSVNWHNAYSEQTFTDSVTMNLLFYWKNDGSYGTQLPIAIDNIEIKMQTCPAFKLDTLLKKDTVTETMFTFSYVNPTQGARTKWLVFSDAERTDTVAWGINPDSVTSFTATDLTPSTTYYVTLYSVCSDDDYSKPLNFTTRTLCSFATLPYFEGFEDMETMTYNLLTMNCWSTTEMTSSKYAVASSSYRHSGNNGLVVYGYDYYNVPTQILALPEIDSLNGKNISFWYKAYDDDDSYYATLQLGYLDASNSFIQINSFTNDESRWNNYNTTISNIPAGVTRLAFMISGSYYYYLDDIRINKVVTGNTYNDTICSGAAYNAHGFNYSAGMLNDGDTSITKTIQAVLPGEADSITTVNIHVRPAIRTLYYDTICAGVSYNKNGFSIAAPKSQTYYNQPVPAACGCDSVTGLQLMVIPVTATLRDTICQGDVYQFGSQSLTQPGTYVDTVPSGYGCDIKRTLYLFVVDSTTTTRATICEGTSYRFEGQDYTQTGIYRVPSTGLHGCSLTKILDLTVTKTVRDIDTSFCKGGQLIIADGRVITTPGTYTCTIADEPTGCTTTYNYTVSEDPIISATATDEACENHTYTGLGGLVDRRITKDTTFTVTTRTLDAKCDSECVVTIKLVKAIWAQPDVVDKPAGETYTWHGNSYNKSVVVQDTLQSIVTGCDSICKLILTIGGVPPVAVENVELLEISLIPNPVTAGQTSFIYGNFSDVKNVEVLNSFGQVVDSFVPSTYPIEVQGINASGIYYVRITTEDERVAVQKLIVK